MWFLFPDTLGKPLEEVAAIFGDHGMCCDYAGIPSHVLTMFAADEVAGYMKDIEITEDDIDAVGGFGAEKGSTGVLEIEKQAAGKA